MAVSYVELYTLRRYALKVLLLDHPYAASVVKRNAVRITLQRSLLRYLAQQKGDDKGPRSFVLKSKAHDPEIVDDSPTVDKKVDDVTGQLTSLTTSLNALQQRMDKREDEMAELTTLLKALVNKQGS